MWVNHNSEIVFIATPKCGSTSMINSLGFEYNSETPREYHASIDMVHSRHPESKGYKSFSFVRNPWDRFVSVYKDGTQSHGHLGAWSSGLLKYKDFTDFAKNFEKSEWANEVHFLPCSSFLKIKGKISVDNVGRFENLHNDFSKITKEIIGSTIDIRHHHNQTKRSKDYKEYYNKETVEIIRKAYKEDIETFNYEY